MLEVVADRSVVKVGVGDVADADPEEAEAEGGKPRAVM